jgi:hypothetical protein
MTSPACAIGKELNPKTCRYIKACRKGYSRNTDFECVKNSNTSQKSMPVIKEKMKLLKDLFSNNEVNSSRKKSKQPNSNGLVNSPPQPKSNSLVNTPQPRSRSKHLKRTHKLRPTKLYNENGNEIPNLETMPFRNPFEIVLEQFIERNGEKLMKMTFGEAKAFARKKGFALLSDKHKNMYKDLLVDYRSKASVPDSLEPVKPENKGKMDKKVQFKSSSASAKKNTQGLSKKESIAKIKEHAKELGYPEETRFMFYSKSSDLKPGKGAGEHLAPEDADKFEELSKIKDWRKKLSNFWIAPFILHGKRWASVEHYYQGSKFKGTPDFYNQFSLDSGSDLSKDPVLAKAAGGKTGKFQGKRVRPKEIVIDSDFFQGKTGQLYRRSDLEMNRAQDAKFIYNTDLMDLLKLTKNAQLVHYQRGGPSIIFYNLMKLRSDV